MEIDRRIFLSRPQDVDLDEVESLSEAFVQAARGADRITLLSAYYGVEYLAQVLGGLPRTDRRNCELTLVFGMETNAQLVRAAEELRRLKAALPGFKTLRIKVFHRDAPFHTKLFYFKRGTRPLWFVGSANASPAIAGARHEMMVRLVGRHDGLASYMDAIADKAISVDAVERTLIIRDRRSFFLNGSLCYPHTDRVNFTFEACPIKAQHRRLLRDSLAAGTNVPHADPKTSGFGFSLVGAVTKISGVSLGETFDDLLPTKQLGRLKFKNRSIETAYGYWLPAPYASERQSKQSEICAASIGRLESLATALQSVSISNLQAELKAHVDGLRSFFASHNIGIQPGDDVARRFEAFVKARTAFLDSPERIERTVRRLNIERMPDLWADEDAALKFETSFFEDLALALRTERKSWVAGVLNDQLETTRIEAMALRSALDTRLRDGWDNGIWNDEEFTDDAEDEE